MTEKLFRSSFLVGITTMLLSMILFMGVLYQYFNGQIVHELTAVSSYLTQGMNSIGADYLTDLDDSQRITWIAPDGTVQYDNWNEIDQMENHLNRTEVQEALKSGIGTANRFSNTLTEHTIYVAQRLENGEIIRVSTTQATMLALFFPMISSILLILFLSMVLSGILASRLSKLIIKPILALDLDCPENTDTYDELAPLLGRIRTQNTTIQKQIDQLRHKQDEFTVVTDNMSEGFLLLDHSGHILSHNSATLTLLVAPSPKDATASYLTLNRSEPFRNTVELALAGQEGRHIQVIQGRHCQVIANPVLRDGTVAGAVIVLLDVTAHEQSETLRREFTANVSHELKTPLTSISGIAEMMQNRLIKPQDIPDFATDIYHEAQRLIALVEDILRLSQLDEGHSSLPLCTVDLYHIATQVVGRMQTTADAMSVTLILNGTATPISGTHQVLGEMISNLVDNAIKYNKPNGTVTVSIQTVDGIVSLSVSDTGVGIPAEDKNRVFERFYRVDKSHSKAIGGTGLGLSIVKHGAIYHGAQIALDSAVDVGTTVTLTF